MADEARARAIDVTFEDAAKYPRHFRIPEDAIDRQTKIQAAQARAQAELQEAYVRWAKAAPPEGQLCDTDWFGANRDSSGGSF